MSKILWTDFHSNIHHEQISSLPEWFDQIESTMDFWPIAYYPFYMRKDECGLGVEDRYSDEIIQKDWEYIRQFTDKVNENGFPMFMGYEWQGAGKDGDHNVFFLSNKENPSFPYRYTELKDQYEKSAAIAIPHHLAYQIDNRGKNWDTQDDSFSPFAEIYSSHGSSENDDTPIPMNRHIHMGPRTSTTCVEKGWGKGHRFGVIASGDNHSCPGVYGFGYAAVIADSDKKEDIWKALLSRHVYGVSADRMKLDFKVDNAIMGDAVKRNSCSNIHIHCEGGDAIDRIELIDGGKVIKMIPHTTTYEDTPLVGKMRFKFKFDAGWGPDTRVFSDITKKNWNCAVKTNGSIISVEKCWSTKGQKIVSQDEKECRFELTTHTTTATGKWMGPSAVTTEGFIFEIEDDIDAEVMFEINGEKYSLTVREMLENSHIISMDKEVHDLLDDKYGFDEYYRTDPWWHNAYKVKVGEAIPEVAYTCDVNMNIDSRSLNSLRVRVWEKNGSVAWSSPIFFDGDNE